MEKSSDGKAYLVKDSKSGNTYKFGSETEARQFEMSIGYRHKKSNSNGNKDFRDNSHDGRKDRKNASKSRSGNHKRRF